MNASVDQALPVRPREGVIFAVDDDEADRQMLVRAIRNANVPCTCRVFAAGDELLDALIDVLRGAPPPVACFVDIKMAGMTGLDVLRWIRAQRGLDAIPVVMLSSSEDPQYLGEAQQFGAQCYAAKFPSPDHMGEIIAAARCYSAAAGCRSSFALPYNLLLGAHASLS